VCSQIQSTEAVTDVSKHMTKGISTENLNRNPRKHAGESQGEKIHNHININDAWGP